MCKHCYSGGPLPSQFADAHDYAIAKREFRDYGEPRFGRVIPPAPIVPVPAIPAEAADPDDSDVV